MLADDYSTDGPTLFLYVSAQSVSICSLEWGQNSPLKQNMAIGAGVWVERAETMGTSRSGVKLNRIPRRVGPKEKSPGLLCQFYFTALRFNFLNEHPEPG